MCKKCTLLNLFRKGNEPNLNMNGELESVQFSLVKLASVIGMTIRCESGFLIYRRKIWVFAIKVCNTFVLQVCQVKSTGIYEGIHPPMNWSNPTING